MMNLLEFIEEIKKKRNIIKTEVSRNPSGGFYVCDIYLSDNFMISVVRKSALEDPLVMIIRDNGTIYFNMRISLDAFLLCL